jgi:hypothetical protein
MNPSYAKLSLRILAVVFVMVVVSSRGMAAGSHLLENNKIKLSITDGGRLESVGNLLASETYSFNADFFVVETNLGEFSNRAAKPASVKADARQVEFRYEFDAVEISLVYAIKPDNAFIRRWLTVRNTGAMRLKNLTLGDTAFAQPARDVLHYVTFIAAPTVEFVRHEKGGWFTGIENPFFKTSLTESGVTLSFAPGLILKAGEGYTSESQFIGVYRKSGVMVADSGREFRYNANGSGYKPLDRNETRAMRAFALDYLDPAQKKFLNINYQFFHPLPQMPHTAQQQEYFTHAIDTFAAIGGDMIIFKPLHRYRKPDANKLFWDVVPDDTNQVARQVCDYARAKGIGYGFYMGCAAHGSEGNAGGLTFRPDKPEWKKSDAAGRRAPDNCLACDEYFDWWFTVQNNTIQKYRLANWSWDPSLGSGMNCHDEAHGHIAGQGAYKGWRNCIELMRRLKAATPGLFIQGFYGTKNFGLWGLKHMDQHEVYNEQTIIVSTRHNQISDDRQNADGLRFQNNWSMRFRFTPAIIGHALAHRISEGGFDPELIKAWDFAGWKYSVMSSLAVAGSVMPTILPYETDLVPGYVDFYKKWQRWARDNFDCVNCTEPFGEQVQPGAVDGYARIKGDHGFIFLFNGNPRASEMTFEVGDEINLQASGRYEFIELYPSESPKVVLDADGHSVFDSGTKSRVIVPANSCFLFELKKVGAESKPLLIGTTGSVARRGDTLEIAGLSGKPGALVPLRVRLDDARGVKRVVVNGKPQKFIASENEIALDVQFAGAPHVREFDAWRLAGGKRFEFPIHAAQSNAQITTMFTLNDDVLELLRLATPKNFAAVGNKIAAWQKTRGNGPNFGNPYSYHNFIGERPERLWLVIPFLRETGVKAELNGRKLTELMLDKPSNSLFADITDLVRYGGENQLALCIADLRANTFLGPFLCYPDEAPTTAVLPVPTDVTPRVVYRGSLVPPMPTRYQRGAGPVVTEAKMMGNVTLKRAAELRANVNLPPEKIRRVMFFESGFPWMGQHPLKYNDTLRCWVAMVKPGKRAAIQEHEEIYVWAEADSGLRSEYVPVKAGWDFLE